MNQEWDNVLRIGAGPEESCKSKQIKMARVRREFEHGMKHEQNKEDLCMLDTTNTDHEIQEDIEHNQDNTDNTDAKFDNEIECENININL